MPTDYQPLYQALESIRADAWAKILPQQIEHALDPSRHGKLTDWLELIKSLPVVTPSERKAENGMVNIGVDTDMPDAERRLLEMQLRQLSPWRKGPYDVFGIAIDSEWRCDWKWQRVKPHITSLKNRAVLDVGCGNGYYGWRMLDEQAKLVVGIDPMLLNVMQFYAIRRLRGGSPSLYVLPVTIESLPAGLKAFDTVFSMGVLYHRRSPIDHLMELRETLIPGGELVLETLVIDGDLGEVLVPEERYARMRNVWFIPSCPSLLAWLKRCGFKNIRLADVTPTTTEEQRSTNWMTSLSLKDFLDPNNPKRTCEGYPAPKRAIIIAQTSNG